MNFLFCLLSQGTLDMDNSYIPCDYSDPDFLIPHEKNGECPVNSYILNRPLVHFNDSCIKWCCKKKCPEGGCPCGGVGCVFIDPAPIPKNTRCKS